MLQIRPFLSHKKIVHSTICCIESQESWPRRAHFLLAQNFVSLSLKVTETSPAHGAQGSPWSKQKTSCSARWDSKLALSDEACLRKGREEEQERPETTNRL